MKNGKNAIQILYENLMREIVESDDEFKKNTEYIRTFNNFFDDLLKKFNDLNVTEIAVGNYIVNSRNLNILRTKYGIYDNGNIQSYDYTRVKCGISNQTIINIESKLIYYIKGNYNTIIRYNMKKYYESLIRQENRRKGNIPIKDTGLDLIALELSKNGINNLMDLLNLSRREILEIDALSNCEKSNLIDYIHSIGLKFQDEFTGKEYKNQCEFLLNKDIIEIIKEHGSPKYKSAKLEHYELCIFCGNSLDKRIFKRLKENNIFLIDQLIAMTKDELLLFIVPSQQEKLVEFIHALGYKFIDELNQNKEVTNNSSDELSDTHNLLKIYREKLEQKTQKIRQIQKLQEETRLLEQEMKELKKQFCKEITITK